MMTISKHQKSNYGTIQKSPLIRTPFWLAPSGLL